MVKEGDWKGRDELLPLAGTLQRRVVCGQYHLSENDVNVGTSEGQETARDLVVACFDTTDVSGILRKWMWGIFRKYGYVCTPA